MRKLFKLNNHGYTLIEIIVTLVITVTVMAAIGSFFVKNIQYNNMAQDEVFIQDQVRNAVRGMTRLVMEKKTVEPLANGARFNNGIAGQLDITWDSSSHELKFSAGTNEEILARDIVSFLVVKNDESLITVTIEGEKRKANFKVVEKIHLRNR